MCVWRYTDFAESSRSSTKCFVILLYYRCPYIKCNLSYLVFARARALASTHAHTHAYPHRNTERKHTHTGAYEFDSCFSILHVQLNYTMCSMCTIVCCTISTSTYMYLSFTMFHFGISTTCAYSSRCMD